jgi:hypothetical protein
VSNRESEIERICQAALDCPPEARAALLVHHCGGDESMRREVEGLLAFESNAHGFMETPVSAMPSRLGPYEFCPFWAPVAWALSTALATPSSIAMWP